MNKSDVIMGIGMGLLSLPLLAKNESKPNIVFILADDLGIGDVQIYNPDGKIPTPNIDKLGREGVIFNDAHSSSSVSTPTRYGILTGRYNWRSRLKAGVLDSYSTPLIHTSRHTIASMLKEEGYTTGCVGKWHLGLNWTLTNPRDCTSVDMTGPVKNGPNDLGFDYSYIIAGSLNMSPFVWIKNGYVELQPDRKIEEEKGYGTHKAGYIAKGFKLENGMKRIVAKSADFIKNYAGQKKPFFLYIPLTAPHTPILPEKRFQGKSGLNPYGDFVLEVDYYVGEIMKSLEKNGISKNTIVVFTSDNGCSHVANFNLLTSKGHNPSGIYRGYKASIYEGGHRIPCIVRYPNGFKSHKVEQPICLTDFYATFASITGYKIKDNEAEDSYNVLPYLDRTNYTKEIREATVHHSAAGAFAICQGKWKLIFQIHPPKHLIRAKIENLDHLDYTIELYDMSNDLREKVNVADKHSDVVKHMTELLEQYVREGRSTPGKAQKNDGREYWAQLVFMKK